MRLKLLADFLIIRILLEQRSPRSLLRSVFLSHFHTWKERQCSPPCSGMPVACCEHRWVPSWAGDSLGLRSPDSLLIPKPLIWSLFSLFTSFLLYSPFPSNKKNQAVLFDFGFKTMHPIRCFDMKKGLK